MLTTRMFGLLLMCFSGLATAQSVYKCRDAAGAVVYQSQACSGITEKQWTPDLDAAVPSSATREAAQRSIERDRQYLQASNRATTPRRDRRTAASRVATVSPCERERQARAAAHERRGVRWSFDDASRWDARVFKACR